jgi:hypothetical protein
MEKSKLHFEQLEKGVLGGGASGVSGSFNRHIRNNSVVKLKIKTDELQKIIINNSSGT